MSMLPSLAFGIGPLGLPEIIVLAVIGLLIFGKRLPDVGKSLGQGIVEFKKGLSGVTDEINSSDAGPKKQDTPKLDQQNQTHTVDTKTEQAQPTSGTNPSS